MTRHKPGHYKSSKRENYFFAFALALTGAFLAGVLAFVVELEDATFTVAAATVLFKD